MDLAAACDTMNLYQAINHPSDLDVDSSQSGWDVEQFTEVGVELSSNMDESTQETCDEACNSSEIIPETTSPKFTLYPCPCCSKTFTLAGEVKKHLQSHSREEMGLFKRDDVEHSPGQKKGTSTKDKYGCPVCNAEFSTLQGLDCHKKVHTDVQYICIVCYDSFATAADYKRHLEETHVVCRKRKRDSPEERPARKPKTVKRPQEGNITCQACDGLFTNVDELTEHMIDGHANIKGSGKNKKKEHKCPTCGSTFPTKYALSIHKNIHKWTRYICAICQEDFTPTAHGDGNGEYTCGSCGVKRWTFMDLSIHMREHVGVKLPLLCFKCISSGKYSTPPQMSGHSAQSTNSRIDSDGENVSFDCLICHTSYHNRNIANHMRNHATAKAACYICGKRFGHQGALNHHLEVHDRLSIQFYCRLCGVNYSPTGEVSVAGGSRCGACGKPMTSMKSLRVHMKEHLSEATSFKCFKCSKSNKSSKSSKSRKKKK